MSFNFIYNPLTNEKYSILSYEGKSLLKQYIKYHQTGGMGQTQAIASTAFNSQLERQIKRQNSLGTIMDKEKKKKNEDLIRASRLAKPYQLKNNKPTLRYNHCESLKNRIQQVKTQANAEINRLNEIFNEHNCNELLNTRVADAFHGLRWKPNS